MRIVSNCKFGGLCVNLANRYAAYISTTLFCVFFVSFTNVYSFYRKRFYTRHLLKVHNIGTTGGNGSEPDSPTTPNAPVTLIGSNDATTNTAIVAVSVPNTAKITTHSHQTTAQTINSHVNIVEHHVVAAAAPGASGARQTQIIRRIVNTTVSGHQNNSGIGTQMSLTSATKMPSIVSIQQAPPRGSTRPIQTSATSAIAISAQQQCATVSAIPMMMTTTAPSATGTRLAGVNNGGAGVATTYVEVKYEPKDELLLLDS